MATVQRCTRVVVITTGEGLNRGSGRELDPVDLVESSRPDVVLLDVQRGGEAAAIEVAKEIRRRSPQSTLVIVTRLNDPRHLIDLMRIGIQGHFTKNAAASELIDGIYRARRGPLLSLVKDQDSKVKDQDSTGARHVASRRAQRSLTAREVQVLQTIAEGNSTQRSAELLGISGRSVDRHLGQIYEKLGADNRTQAVLMALREEIIALPSTGL